MTGSIFLLPIMKNIPSLNSNLGQLSNPNLLINPNFKINQRGGKVALQGTDVYRDAACTDKYSFVIEEDAVEVDMVSNGNYTFTTNNTYYVKSSDVVNGYCGSYKYGVDRWFYQSSNGSIIIQKINDGLKIKWTGNNDGIVHRFEKGILLDGKTYTISVSIDGIVYSKTFVNTTSDSIVPYSNDKSYCYAIIHNDSYDAVYPFVDYSGSGECVVNWVKLELGSVATPFVPPEPATELAKCQRYFYSVFNKDSSSWAYLGDGRINGDTQLLCGIDLPCKMRTFPTLKYGGTFVINGDVGVSNIILDDINSSNALLNITTSSNITLYTNAYAQRSGSDAYMYFDAEIY